MREDALGVKGRRREPRPLSASSGHKAEWVSDNLTCLNNAPETPPEVVAAGYAARPESMIPAQCSWLFA